MTPQEIEQYVLVASDATNLQNQQQANVLLNHWVTNTEETVLAETLLQVLTSSQREVVLFFTLTTMLQLRRTTLAQRRTIRQKLLTLVTSDCWTATYLRTKVGVVLARFVQLDWADDQQSWSESFELQSKHPAPDILLRTLVALMDDFGHDETKVNATLKDAMRGYYQDKAVVPAAQSVSAQLLKTVASLLAQSLESSNSSQIAVLSLTVLKGFMSWVDLSLLLSQEFNLTLIFNALAKGSTTNSPMADAAVVAMECLQELIARGMEDEKKLALLSHTNVLATIHAHVNLEQVDQSPIDVVLEVAKFINRTGLEIMPTLKGSTESTTIQSQLLDLFFRCFAYDDIDVSGAVIPLAGSFLTLDPTNDQILSQLLTITYRQMRYPADFQYDYEDEDEAEEELYRTELRKLHQSFIRIAPETCLQFTCQALSQLSMPLSAAATPDVEAALRLVYHYCEGIRPPPGMKVVMRNETFCNLLVALHTSDITLHPHREVLTLYYETAVRYHPLLKERPELLQKLLGALTGTCGLQHDHARVRSRCCYLLLRLVKSVGTNNKSNPNVLRPYVETAVSGIQGLLQNNSLQLRSDDTLNLFETIGLLLGKTGLEEDEQQRYLTQVMTPHVQSIKQVLSREVGQDPEAFGEILSGSIAAIAYLSKGFKTPSEPVQMVLLETLQIAVSVLEALPQVEAIRNKTFVFVQRLIQCLGDKVLPTIPRILYLLLSHCTTVDCLDVAQLFNQLSIKFKDKAIPALDAALLPFLQKCHELTVGLSTSNETSSNETAPHQRTEQLSIQKLTFSVLQHVVIHGATAVLYSPTNLSSLETVLQSMSEGAIHVEDPSMKKTCLIFFKELLDQWVVVANDNGKTSPPPGLQEGYVRFVCDVLIPGVLESFCQESFRVEDANQWRCVLELGAILNILKERLPDVYYQKVLVATLTNRLGCPSSLAEAFQNAGDRKALELNLKTLIQTKKNKS